MEKAHWGKLTDNEDNEFEHFSFTWFVPLYTIPRTIDAECISSK